MTGITPARARAILAAGRGKEIAVIGDVMLDEFLWGRVSRISPEAPVPVVEVVRESFQLGGAANVAHNLHRLGAVPLLIGVLGEDEAARRLRDILSARGIAAEGLVDDGERPTTLKTRIIAHSQQVVRADRESQQDITKAVEALALERTTKAVARADALVLSDYSKGMLTPRLVEQSIALARNRQIPILVDPKLRRFAAYKHVSLVTPNVGEAEEASRVAIDGPTGLEGAANVILATLHCQAVLITRGEKGMALFEKQQSPVHIGAASREVFDVTGAGDTVIATAAFAMAAGASVVEAAQLANQAAGIVVGKLGTATVEPAEMVRSLSAGNAERR